MLGTFVLRSALVEIRYAFQKFLRRINPSTCNFQLSPRVTETPGTKKFEPFFLSHVNEPAPQFIPRSRLGPILGISAVSCTLPLSSRRYGIHKRTTLMEYTTCGPSSILVNVIVDHHSRDKLRFKQPAAYQRKYTLEVGFFLVVV